MEDKQKICDALLECLKLTRYGMDIAAIRYFRQTESDEEVIIYFKGEGTLTINVSMDSGIGMLRDILKKL